jgi:hypothetical protein
MHVDSFSDVGSSLSLLQRENHLSLALLSKPPTLIHNPAKRRDCDHGPGLSLALASSEESLSSSSESKIGGLDVAAVGKYMLALAIQMGLTTGIFTGLDKVVAKYSFKIPFAINCIMFYVLALKSRAFNPLSNCHPKPRAKVFEDAPQCKMPT